MEKRKKKKNRVNSAITAGDQFLRIYNFNQQTKIHKTKNINTVGCI